MKYSKGEPRRGLYCKRCHTHGWDYSVDQCPNCGCKTLWCDEGKT